MKEKRDQLVAELKLLNESRKKISSEIDKIDYEEKFNKNNQYVGKYFRMQKDCPHYIFIYGINPSNCELHSLQIHDFSNGEGTHFSINYSSIYNMKDKLNSDIPYDDTAPVEVSKEEFEKNFTTILQLIMQSVNKKINEN